MIPISPLSLNQLTRNTWGQFDAAIIAQLAGLADDPRFAMKFYKAPADDQEVMAALAYVTYGLRITPGSIIFGFYLPCTRNATLALPSPGAFTVQITDVSLGHKLWDAPVASVMIANYKPEYQNEANMGTLGVNLNQGSFPNLLCCPHRVTGSGQFDVEIQETSGEAQRIELVFGVLEFVGGA